MKSIDCETFLQHGTGEGVVLSVLCEKKEIDAEEFVKRALNRLWELDKGSKIMFARHVSQLRILSKLRDMEQLIKREVEKMPVTTIDVSNDYLYLRGERKGRLETRHEDLLEMIEFGLEIKFGSSGLKLIERIRQIDDIDKLEAIKETLRRAADLQEVEKNLK